MYSDNQERVDAYLRNEMTEEERKRFEEDLEQDEVLRGDYMLTRELVVALEDRREKLDLMRMWSAGIIPADTERQVACGSQEDCLTAASAGRRFRIRRWVYGLGTAACVAIGFFVGKSLLFTAPSPDDSSMIPVCSSAPSYRSARSEDSKIPICSSAPSYRNARSEEERVDSLTNAGGYVKALALVDSEIENCNLRIAGYAAQDSLSERDSYKKLQYEESLYDLEWHKINLLIALDRKEEARTLLKDFASKEGPRQREAKTLLKKFEKN